MRQRDGAAEAMRVGAKALDGVVRGLARRNEEWPVARLREQELAHRLSRGAVAKGITPWRGGAQTVHLARETAELVPHPGGAFVEPGRMIVVLSPGSFRKRDALLWRLTIEV